MLLLALGACAASPELAAPPEASSNLDLAAPIESWDEAIPLGNGRSGGLLWGGGRRVVLSLDRGDLWDLRTPDAHLGADWTWTTVRALHAAGDHDRLTELFVRPFAEIPYPTKIQAGRLELDLAAPREVQRFGLDLERAEGRVQFAGGRIDVMFCATDDVVLLRCPADPPPVLRLLPPAAAGALGYPPARQGGDDASWWLVQEDASGGCFAVVAAWRDRQGRREIALAIAPASDPELALRDGRERVARALEAGYEALFLQHRAWWRAFWGSSNVTIPDPELQAHYELVKYLYGAGSRRGAPPLGPQGPWTDDGGLPPRHGGYDHAHRAELAYLACQPAGLEDAGASFTAWHQDLLPAYRELARRGYGVEGALVPGAMAVDGQPLGGAPQYALSPTAGAFVAHAFWRQWRYTMDDAFLAERAYPFCSEIGRALAALLAEGGAGEPPRLPLSASPELFDDTMRAWLPPDSNYDQALLRWLYAALAEMASALRDEAAARRWAELHARLEPLVQDATGALAVARGVGFDTTHRLFSHALAIHPLGLLDVADERQKAIVDATLDGILSRGTGAWTGASFAWMACLLARAGRGDAALEHLRTYRRAFVARNGFHLSGDLRGEGLTSYRERQLALEGNFLAMQAVHEMLLQSHGGVIAVFPAVGRAFGNAAFEQLRTEGGHRVSAVRLDGRTKSVAIVAGRSGTIRLRDPFTGGIVLWNADVAKSDDGVYEVAVTKGNIVRGTVLAW